MNNGRIGRPGILSFIEVVLYLEIKNVLVNRKVNIWDLKVYIVSSIQIGGYTLT